MPRARRGSLPGDTCSTSFWSAAIMWASRGARNGVTWITFDIELVRTHLEAVRTVVQERGQCTLDPWSTPRRSRPGSARSGGEGVVRYLPVRGSTNHRFRSGRISDAQTWDDGPA